MAKSSNQKLKLMHLANILQEKTDEDHGLTMPELPRDLVEKTPTDGLSGHSDEERLGILYADIHKFIRLGTCGDAEIDEKIANKERWNLHKRRMPVILQAGVVCD